MILDLHNHTSESSFCSKINGQLYVERFSERTDVDGFCVTDHFCNRNLSHLLAGKQCRYDLLLSRLFEGYRCAKKHLYKNNKKVFCGLEYSVGKNELLLYGFEPEDLANEDYLLDFNLEALSRIKDKIPSLVVIQAHPCRGLCQPVFDSIVDGYEVYNGMFFHDEENSKAKEFALNTGLPATGGTDCHEDDVGRMMTVFSTPINSNYELGWAIKKNKIAGFRIKDIIRDEFIPSEFGIAS